MSNTINITNPLCKYKYIFGVPNKGIHQYRLGGLAIADIIQTMIAAFVISWLFKIKFWICFVALFVIGEVLHKLFCIDTAFTKWMDSIVSYIYRFIRP